MQGKGILLIIAPFDFSDRELATLTSALSAEGATLTIVSSTGQPTKGMHGTQVTPAASFYNINSADFAAAVFIGGPGAEHYFHNRHAQRLAREFVAAGKPVAALDIAPSILANAHVLSGRRATARPTERENIAALGTWTGAPVEIDGNIITAASSAHALEVASALIKMLKAKV